MDISIARFLILRGRLALPLLSIFEKEPRVAVAAGDYLFREGDTPDFLYYLISGRARMLIGTREIEIFGPRQIVGEMALLGNTPRSGTIQALTVCEFARIDEKRFLHLVTMTPGFAITVMRVMAKRLQAANVHQATPATHS